MIDSRRIGALTNRVIDAEEPLTEREWVELRALVESHPDAWELYRRTLDTETLLRSLDARIDLTDSVMEAIEAEDKVCSFPRWRTVAGVSAACLLVFAGLRALRENPALDVSGGLQPEQRVTVTDSESWTFADETTFAAEPGTEFVFAPDLEDENRSSKRLALIQGAITAEVAPQPEGSPFVIQSPHAKAVVRGTRFEITTDGVRDRLSVRSGVVDFVAPSGKTIHVAAGETGVASEVGVRHLSPLVYYDFTQQSLKDFSSQSPKLDLVPTDGEAELQWKGGIVLDGSFFLTSRRPTSELVARFRRSNEMAIEVWLTPSENIQGGPARIATLTRGSGPRSIMLAQGQYQLAPAAGYIGRTPGGQPVSVPESPARRTHLLFSQSQDGVRRIFVNGEKVAESRQGADAGQWPDSFPLSIGGDLEGDEEGQSRNWKGTLHLVRIYDRAIGAEDVQTLYHSLP